MVRSARRALAWLCVVALATPLAAQSVRLERSPEIGLPRDPALTALLGELEPARLFSIDSALVSFGTRHTMSDTVSATRGIGASRRWIHAWLTRASAECGGCLVVQYDAAPTAVDRAPGKPTVNVVNVLATLKGRDTSRVIVMGGHYDSCICTTDRWDATSDAPGADDDGSGTAAVMELARLFGKRFPQGFDATIIFALYAGEEQGLLGSTNLAKRLKAEGKLVTAAFTDDIVGNTVAEDGTRDGKTIRLFAADPDNGPSRELGRYTWAIGGRYPTGLTPLPVWRLDRIGRGGDHAPFVAQGWAGLRFTERLENYKRQHLPTDALKDVDFDYVAKVARLNAAVVGALAQAPATPTGTTFQRDAASGGQAWTLGWQAVPGATSYEVLVRRTSAPQWETVLPAGTGTSYLLRVQLDDVVAGVRAVGPGGARSMAAAIPAPTPAR